MDERMRSNKLKQKKKHLIYKIQLKENLKYITLGYRNIYKEFVVNKTEMFIIVGIFSTPNNHLDRGMSREHV